MTPDRKKAALRTLKSGSEVKAPRRCLACQRVIKLEDDDPPQDPYCLPTGSTDCREAAVEKLSQEKLRSGALARDGGVCAFCGEKVLEVEALRDQMRELGGRDWDNHRKLLVKCGFRADSVREGKTLWEAHHLDEKVKGGGDSLSNIATACQPCHRDLTKGLASSRASSRRPMRRGR